MLSGKSWKTAAILSGMVLAFGPLGAQEEAPTPAGHWVGAIVTPGGELEIDLDLSVEGDVWTGDISIPAQMTQDFPLSEVTVNGNQTSFLMAGVPGDPTFTGTLSEDGQSLTGTFSQSGMSMDFRLTRGDPLLP